MWFGYPKVNILAFFTWKNINHLYNFSCGRWILNQILFYWNYMAYIPHRVQARQNCPLIFIIFQRTCLSRKVSTTPITAMGCRQCLPLSVVQLKGKHCRKPHCRNWVADTFEPWCFYSVNVTHLLLFSWDETRVLSMSKKWALNPLILYLLPM